MLIFSDLLNGRVSLNHIAIHHIIMSKTKRQKAFTFSKHFSFDHDGDNLQNIQNKPAEIFEIVRILQFLSQCLALQLSSTTIVTNNPLTFHNIVVLFVCVVNGNCREITVCLSNNKVPLSKIIIFNKEKRHITLHLITRIYF